MSRYLTLLTLFLSTLITSSAFGDSCCCVDLCTALELGVGWRRDSLNWKVKDMESSYISAEADSRIHYKDVEFYVGYGKVKWVGSEFYIKLEGEYGQSQKGRAEEHFHIESSILSHSIHALTDNPIKRRSEVYDFDLAFGYPITFCHCRGYVVPMIGCCYHRQRLRVKDRHSSSSSSSSYFDSSDFEKYSSEWYNNGESIDSSFFYPSSYSSSDFIVSPSNPFNSFQISDPFGSPSSDHVNIASVLGLSTDKRTDMERFTWYGPFLGLEVAYGLDPHWTLRAEGNFNFLNNCHRKRDSKTGVYFVDGYHRKGWAYGFDGLVSTTYMLDTCWFFTGTAQYKWWKAHSTHDELHWTSVELDIGIGFRW